MKKPVTYYQIFVDRIKSNFIENYEITHIKDNVYKIESTNKKDSLAIQGLIYHFINRNWITNDNYDYISQNIHFITFAS